MAVPVAALPQGTRVKVVPTHFPQEAALIGRTGIVLNATEYQTQSLGVVLDGETTPRYFAPVELEVISTPALPPERELAKRRRALP